MRRILRRTLLITLALLAACAALAWWSWSPGAKSHALVTAATPLPAAFRTWPEHNAIYQANDDPYVFSWAEGERALCYFGVFHVADRQHPHMRALHDRWRTFKPTIALCEGRARGHMTRWPFSSLPQGEPALVHELARDDGIPIWSLEPPYEAEVRALLVGSTKQRVALYFALRVYWSEAAGSADEALFLDLLKKRTDVPQLQGALPDLAAVDAEWSSLHATHGDWRTRTEEPLGTWIADLSERSRIVRGEHMIRLLLELTRRGERVFAVVGRSHVIRHELVLQAALDG